MVAVPAGTALSPAAMREALQAALVPAIQEALAPVAEELSALRRALAERGRAASDANQISRGRETDDYWAGHEAADRGDRPRSYATPKGTTADVAGVSEEQARSHAREAFTEALEIEARTGETHEVVCPFAKGTRACAWWSEEFAALMKRQG
jgi:hypothetical protein